MLYTFYIPSYSLLLGGPKELLFAETLDPTLKQWGTVPFAYCNSPGKQRRFQDASAVAHPAASEIDFSILRLYFRYASNSDRATPRKGST